MVTFCLFMLSTLASDDDNPQPVYLSSLGFDD